MNLAINNWGVYAALKSKIKLFPPQPEKCLAECSLFDKELQPAQITALKITSRLNRATKSTLN